jgi:hypothetical protein
MHGPLNVKLILSFGLSRLLHERATLPSRKELLCMHRIFDWVGSRAGPDGLEKRSISCPAG